MPTAQLDLITTIRPWPLMLRPRKTPFKSLYRVFKALETRFFSA
jgi:hypothetical protein